MVTASTIFLRSLVQCGITHAFVNWGSDHPAILEELERQRTNSGGICDLRIITCPNEMVALSAAQGFAQACGRPAAVLIHVDVGTQALGGAVHNADRGRVPVFIYAGASPFTSYGEMKGSRNEWIMWLQDVHDQPAIVRQYMRYTCQMNSSKTISQNVQRALQFAMSDPKGPVYLWARREVMEEEVCESAAKLEGVKPRAPVEPAGLNVEAVNAIVEALLSAQQPVIITSHIGKNIRSVSVLCNLANMLEIPVISSCPSVVNIPHSDRHFVELSYGFGECAFIRGADVIIIIESDVPFIPVHNKPQPSARVFHVDTDVLKENISSFDLDAEMYCRADAHTALLQILSSVRSKLGLTTSSNIESLVASRRETLLAHYQDRILRLDRAEAKIDVNGMATVPFLIASLRKAVPVPEKTLFLNESVSNFPQVWEHLRPEFPGSVISSGSSSLGWALGAAVGASLAGGRGTERDLDLLVSIVGDGSFLFGVPSTTYWMARRYNTPFLTIILNNGGWKSPMLSMLAMHPNGTRSKHAGERWSVGFGPELPDYAMLAEAAGRAWGKKITKQSEIEDAIKAAIAVVRGEKRCAVLDCVLESF